MSACDPIRKRLSAYLDDEVPLPERVVIEDHLGGCAACRGLREELARATQVLASAPEPHWAPDSTDALVGRLRAQIAREAPATPPAHVIAARAPAGFNWRALAIPLAAVCLVVAVPGLWIGTRTPVQEPQRAVVATKPEPQASPQLAQAPAPVVAVARAQQVRADEAPKELAAAKAQDSGAMGGAGPRGKLEAADPIAKNKSDALAFSRPAKPAAPPPPVLANMAAPGGVASQPVGIDARANAGPAPAGSGALSGIDIEIAELERRMAAVEAAVGAFTTAAREQAHRESSQVASRRFPTWR